MLSLLKIAGKSKGQSCHGTPEEQDGRTLSNIKTNYAAIDFETGRYLYNNRQEDKWYKIEHPDTDSEVNDHLIYD
jgi:hypothetical protein